MAVTRRISNIILSGRSIMSLHSQCISNVIIPLKAGLIYTMCSCANSCCMYTACLSGTLKSSSELQCSDVVEVRNQFQCTRIHLWSSLILPPVHN